MKRGTKVLWGEMPGTIVDAWDGDIQIEWQAGHESPFSGGTYWGLGPLIADGRIVVLDAAEPEPPQVQVPEPMRVQPPDMFERAFRLAFDL